jgi:probable HAF family extracellular repeat protein
MFSNASLTRLHARAGAALFLLTLFSCASSLSADPGYSISPLGTPGVTDFHPNAINNLGQIVGYTGKNLTNSQRPALYIDGTLTTLPLLNGYLSGTANDINDLGQIVGESLDRSQNLSRGFLYSEGTMTNLGTLSGFTNSSASALNNSGQIVGTSYNTGVSLPQSFGYVYQNGTMTSIGALSSNYKFSEALSINNAGVIGAATGAGINRNGAWYAATIVKNGLQTLLIGTSEDSSPVAINDMGQAVGYYTYPSGPGTFPFMVKADGTQVNLRGMLDAAGFWAGTAESINNLGYVVGTAFTSKTGSQVDCFLYSPDGSLTLFSNLVSLSNGTTPGFTSLYSVSDINDLGQIIGIGKYFDGEQTYDAPYMLQVNAIPEPSSLGFAAAGACGVFLFFRKRIAPSRG